MKTDQSSILARWKAKKKNVKERLKRRPVDVISVPTKGQRRLYALQELNPNNPFYQYGHKFYLQGRFAPERFVSAVNQTVFKHEILRTNFIKDENNQLILKIHEVNNDTAITSIESSLFSFQSKQAKNNQSEHFFSKSFDLSKDNLFRYRIIYLSEDQYEIWFSIHHIIGDRSSFQLLIKEIFEIYSPGQRHETADDINRIQYADFAHHQYLSSPSEEDMNFWSDRLKDKEFYLDLPYDYKRPKKLEFRGDIVELEIDKKLYDSIQKHIRMCESSPFLYFLSVYKILLHLYSRSNTICIGSAFSLRDRQELEDVIGFFTETLIIRSELSDEYDFTTLLESIKKNYLHTFQHRKVTMEDLMKLLKPKRLGNSNPLFQSMFLYNKHNSFDINCDEFTFSEEAVNYNISKFDLTLFVNETKEGAVLRLEYSSELFNQDTARSILHNYDRLLKEIHLNDKTPIRELSHGSNSTNSNLTPIPKPPYSTFLGFFDHQIKTKPQHLAVTYNQQSLSYSELDIKSNKLANYLLSLGCKSGEVIGIQLDRSTDMIVGILAVMKIGSCYLPLDPAYPKHRLEYMIKDASVKVILTQASHIGYTGVKTVQVESARSAVEVRPEVNITKKDAAYIIYTSGSTGSPKGVKVSHDNLVHSTYSRYLFYPENPEAFLLMSSFSFDSSITGIFWTLSCGGKLVLPPKRVEQDLALLSKIVREEKVTHSLMLPSLYQTILNLVNPIDLQSLKNIMVAGESCNGHLVSDHFEKLPWCELYNEYGPTEATVWSIAHRIEQEDTYFVPIGRAIPYMRSFILNEVGNQVGDGEIGELYLGGKGVTDGYLNLPKVTAERFVQFSWSENPQERFYRTGDMVRRRANGVIEFLGRIDNQIKIRGHRVELDEIKTQILKTGLCSNAEVIVKSDEKVSSKLLAFVEGCKIKDLTEIKKRLLRDVPDYMVPSIFQIISEIPKLPNGKLNKEALNKIKIVEEKTSKTFKEASSDTERKLQVIWQQLLHIDKISITDNFFEIGGNSILSIYMVSRAREVGIELKPNQIFRYQTIEQLSEHLADKEKNYDNVLTLKYDAENNSKLFCIHSGGGYAYFYKQFAECIDPGTSVYSIQAKGLDHTDDLDYSIEGMASNYIESIKKIQPEGPYRLLGTCFSNAVVVEMCYQLEQEKEKVERIFIVDSAPLHLFGNEGSESRTLRRMWDLLRRGEITRVVNKVKGRVIKKDYSTAVFNQEKHLKKAVYHFNDLYANYQWKAVKAPIEFLRSSEFAKRRDKNYHVTQWEKLATKGINIHVIEGHHKSLFLDPEAVRLAGKVSYLMQKT